MCSCYLPHQVASGNDCSLVGGVDDVRSLELDEHTRLVVLTTEDDDTHNTEIGISIEHSNPEVELALTGHSS